MEQNSERWSQQKRRSIIIAVIFLIICGIIASITVGIVLYRSKEKEDICNTPKCQAVSKRILNQINPLVNPCDNFYEFACGGFLKEVNISEARSRVEQLDSVKDVIRRRIRKLLIEPIMPKEAKLLTSLKEQYKICMNEQTNFEEMKKIIEEAGGWPVLKGNSWAEERFDWKETIYHFSRLGFFGGFYLLNIRISMDTSNSNTLAKTPIYIIDLPRLTEAIYRDYVVNVAVMFGANRAEAEKELSDSVKFEIELLNATTSRKKNTTSDPNFVSEISISPCCPSMEISYRTTVAQLEIDYPFIPWLEYLNKVFGKFVTISKNDQVEVDSDYLNKLKDMMRITPKRILANYLYWKTVSITMQYLTNQLAEAEDQFLNTVRGYTGYVKRTRTDRCVSLLHESLPMAFNILYIREFALDGKGRVEKLFFNMRQELERIFRNNTWMDVRTKTYTMEKLRALKYVWSFPNEILNDTIFSEHFDDIPFNKRSFLRTMLNLIVWQFKIFSKPVDEWLQRMTAMKIGGRQALYINEWNALRISPVIQEVPYFDKDYPLYVNYGSIGFIIGHHISNVLDTYAKKYDKTGNLSTTEINKIYMDKVNCLIQQYQHFTGIEDGVDVALDSKQTVLNNIADNIGIKITHSAYDTQIKSIGEEPKLPNLKYTGRQLFWISNANIWCKKFSRQTLQGLFRGSDYAPARYRIWGIYSNMKEFATDFECPMGARMNPVNKCQLA